MLFSIVNKKDLTGTDAEHCNVVDSWSRGWQNKPRAAWPPVDGYQCDDVNLTATMTTKETLRENKAWQQPVAHKLTWAWPPSNSYAAEAAAEPTEKPDIKVSVGTKEPKRETAESTKWRACKNRLQADSQLWFTTATGAMLLFIAPDHVAHYSSNSNGERLEHVN